MKRFIVKVQVSLFGAPMILIYNRDRSMQVTFPQDKVIMAEMNGDLKKFFYAHLNYKTKKVVLDEVAPWQSW